MQDEKLLIQMNEGSTAAVCLNWMAPLFDDCEKAIIANLKNCVRTGSYSETILASGVSSLLVIEDLKNRLGGMARSGEAAKKRLDERTE